MDDADAVVLQLRFRGHEPSHAPPDVDAFRRRPAAPSVAELHARPHEVAVLKGSQPLESRAPLVIFFQHAAFGIPAIEWDDADALVDVANWSVRPTVFGWLACVSQERREPRRSRAALIIAACLPLALVTEAAAAPTDKGAIQRPKKSRPVVPPPAVEAEPTAEPEPAPESLTDPFGAEGPPASDAAPTEPSTDETASPEPPPPPKAGTFGSDPSIVDAAWEGVDGFDVELELKGGRRLRGRIGAVQPETFTLIESPSGAVLVLPKSGVLSLRARSAPKLPSKTGGGLLAGGIVLTSIASPVFISGVVFVAICPSCTYIHLPLLIIGAGMLAGGIPMTVLGARRRAIYRRVLEERALAPVVTRTPHGWTGGIRFRF